MHKSVHSLTEVTKALFFLLMSNEQDWLPCTLAFRMRRRCEVWLQCLAVFTGTQSHGSRAAVYSGSLPSATAVLPANMVLAACLPHTVRRIECAHCIILHL